ncbi:MAG: hypothetical protein J2P46_08135 [Zavarzinella sp.]|nr:hypothetical protein [Zavarzinella sp.]
MFLSRYHRLFAEFWALPRVTVNLMRSAAGDNDPFFDRLVMEHYRAARRRRLRHLFLREMVHGVALSQLPATFDEYYMRIEGSARRNHKKALREGCEVRRITFNDHLGEIAEIRASTDTRQGRLMPEEYRKGLVRPVSDPASRTPIHDYPYFGVFLKGKMIGYGGCLIAGEYCGVEQVLGHADHLALGAVPLLLVGIAKHLYEHHRQVRYYAYGTYFGASESLRRFKRKFDFHPHRVTWVLDAPVAAPQTPPVTAT